MSDIISRGYARPEALVSTEWVAARLGDRNLRIVESNEDALLYPSGHIPGAVHVDWAADLNDHVRRDYVDGPAFESLMSRLGVRNDTTVVLYGDQSNWWACYTFWVFHLFDHTRVKVMDGGRAKWEQEGRPMTRDVPRYGPVRYSPRERDDSRIRAFREDVLLHVRGGKPLVDVRTREEYTGRVTHMPEYPQESVLRGGHVPGARNVPWMLAANHEDGTFKDHGTLRRIYEKEQGLGRDDEIITYCRIGERSSHTWFVLTYLLGYRKVRNYDGSWTEWGNSVGLPIEKP